MANRKNKSKKRITKKKRGGWKISPNRKSAKRYSISRTPNKKKSYT
jgi:hypothetical protein